MEQDLIIYIIELLGTFAFAISGIRHAAAKHFDWFGGYVCGVAVAIGGGTIRDVMLGTTPFWMTTPIYLICTGVALLTVVWFGKWMEPLKNAWFVFDTLGLALFTIAGIQKSLTMGQPFWVAIIMGCKSFAMYCLTTNPSSSIKKSTQWPVYWAEWSIGHWLHLDSLPNSVPSSVLLLRASSDSWPSDTISLCQC